MAITHFKITKLPSPDVLSMIGADALVKDQLYPIARQSELLFSRKAALSEFYLLDSLIYQVYEDTTLRYGSPAEIKLEWKENDLATPLLSADFTANMIKDQSVSLLSFMPINKAVEYVEITSITGVNNMKLNGAPVTAGDKLSPSQLSKATFEVSAGGGLPYFTLQYKLGRNNTLAPEIYGVTVNVDTLAGVAVIEQLSDTYMVTDDNGYTEQYTSDNILLQVSGAPSLAQVVLEIIVDHPWVVNDALTETSVIIEGTPKYITLNPEQYQVTTSTAKTGEIQVRVSTEFRYTTGEVHSGYVSVRIVSINGSAFGISPNNHTATAQTTR